jgi:molybdopterin-guanine dinucleotide biosynthesis adapter protein
VYSVPLWFILFNMKVFGLRGWSGSGKTTLLVRLIPELVGRGLRVSTVKHAHHGFDVDQPGKDSFRHRAAGATEVMVSSARRFALMHERGGADEATLEELLARMSPVDLVLVEGFKEQSHDKLEIWRAATDKPLLAESDPHVVAVATTDALPDIKLPVLDLDDVPTIASFIIRHCGLEA